MTFGEVMHYVPHSKAWPEPVRAIASFLSPLHSADRPGFQECPALNPPESSGTSASPSTRSYTAMDFQHLIDSTVVELNALAELPHYGGVRSTVPLWSQLLHALANTFSPDVLILEETSFVMPRAQNVASQPSDLIDGHATLIAAHTICSSSRNDSDRSGACSRNGEDEDELMDPADSSPMNHSDRSSTTNCSGSADDEDESMYSADSGSSDGSLDSLGGLDLPLQAHMLPGRGRWHYAVLPVLLVADTRNIVPLLCSTLYQRHVWGIREPVVGLCCSNTGTTATTILGWLDYDESEEDCMPVAHLAVAASDKLDPSMGVFDFTDSCSAISMAQFVLRLRSHFQLIKDVTSIEAVNSLTPIHWRSDLPDFETQLNNRVASWTHQVHVQTSPSETSSSGPRTPSPLSEPLIFLSSEEMSPPGRLDDIDEDAVGSVKSSAPQSDTPATKNKKKGPVSRPLSSKQASKQSSQRPPKNPSSRISNSVFAAKPDDGLVEGLNMSNWLFERCAFTVGRIAIPPDGNLATDSGVNEMIQIYDAITAFTWSDAVRPTLSDSTIDSSVLCVRDKLFEIYEREHRAPTTTKFPITMPTEDIKYISARLSAMLHAVQGARDCEEVAALYGANEAERRHEWDALLLTFFRPVPGERDVLLERRLNFARNLAVDDTSFTQRARSITRDYQKLCHAQLDASFEASDVERQALAAVAQAVQFSIDISDRVGDQLAEQIMDHSMKEPDKGICDAVLVIPCSGANTLMLQHIQGIKAQIDFLKTFTLIHSNPDKPAPGPIRLSKPQTPASSHASERQPTKEQKPFLQNLFLVHPDRTGAVNGSSEEIPLPDASGLDLENALLSASGPNLLLPILLSEYKKKGESTITKAMNQMKAYLVSSLHFLAALNLTEQPVFGLVVNGRIGAVMMAWQKNKKIYIMERNIRSYDITDPMQAFQFVSVLLRLVRHSLKLRACFEQRKDTVYKNLVKSRWSKLAQIEEEEERKCIGSEKTQK